MGKNSYTNGAVTINGETKASTYKKGNTVYTNYNMSPYEQQAYNYAQQSFAENLPNVNVFSEDTQKQIQKQLNAYKQQGIDTINEVYTPMIDSLKSDIASRFGNYDNSSFLNDLSDIESSRSDAISSLAQNLILEQNDLVNAELSRRYDYLNFLSGVNSQTLSNIAGYSSLASANSSSSSSSNNIGTYVQMGLQLLSSFF